MHLVTKSARLSRFLVGAALFGRHPAIGGGGASGSSAAWRPAPRGRSRGFASCERRGGEHQHQDGDRIADMRDRRFHCTSFKLASCPGGLELGHGLAAEHGCRPRPSRITMWTLFTGTFPTSATTLLRPWASARFRSSLRPSRMSRIPFPSPEGGGRVCWERVPAAEAEAGGGSMPQVSFASSHPALRFAIAPPLHPFHKGEEEARSPRLCSAQLPRSTFNRASATARILSQRAASRSGGGIARHARDLGELLADRPLAPFRRRNGFAD